MGHTTEITSETLLSIYRTCSLIRQSDMRFREVIRAGRLAMPYYSPSGQEVIPAAISVLLKKQDYIVTIYRGLHDQLAKGVPLKELWAEFAGKVTGTCKGKGGAMHITHPASGVMVTTGIVGSGLPIANGLAMASQIRGEDRVTVCYFGDGASNIGAFHEAMNLASIWKLPVVFVCQNNLYAEHSSYSFATSVERIAERGAAYKIPAVTVDGNDAVKMWEAAKVAIERSRLGGGPTLIEAMTFRFYGHVLGDDSHYMRPDELKTAIQNDPVTKLRTLLIKTGDVSLAAIEGLEAEIKRELDEAVEFAMSSEYPGLHELTTDIFGDKVVA